ncbi:hypothetical protein K1719_017736 [Acacia pycnantha]|nr:hypothetical protein K1719_017736 [Acacia pycnantha]
MEDTGQRKTPPDRPSDSDGEGRKKKKKVEEIQAAIIDDNMNIVVEESEECPEVVMDHGQPKNLGSEQVEAKNPVPSYKQSLLGFNGVANGGISMESDDLFEEDNEIFWKMPEPSEEIKRLMHIYPVVPITPEEYNEWCKPWNYSLVITVLGRKYNLYMLRSYLARLWGISEFELVDLPNNYFVVKFTNTDCWRAHYRKVLYDGPWVIAGHCVLVQRWTPYFDPFKNSLGRIVTWIRIPNIPLNYYNNHCIARIGERIGRPLRVDLNTLADKCANEAKVERGRYARLCVELDLQKQLVPRIIAAGEIFNVEYEGLKLICFECGRYGHRREACSWNKTSPASSEEAHEVPQTQVLPDTNSSSKTPVTGETFGPWMFVSRSTKSRYPKQNYHPERRGEVGRGPRVVRKEDFKSSPSRYAALMTLDEEEEVVGDFLLQDEIAPAHTQRTDMTPFDKKGSLSSKHIMVPTRGNGVGNATCAKTKGMVKGKGKAKEKDLSLVKSGATGLSKINNLTLVKSGAVGESSGSNTFNKETLMDKGNIWRPIVAKQRTHIIVSGELGQCGQAETGKTNKMDTLHLMEKYDKNDQLSPHPHPHPMEYENAVDDSLMIEELPSPKPPDITNTLPGSDIVKMVDEAADISGDQSDDLECVPATDLSR